MVLGEHLIHLENVLVYDIPPIVAAVGSVIAAKVGIHNKGRLDEVNKAVNGHDDPATPPLKDQVADVKDKVEAQG